MWQLFKADLLYHKFILIISYLLALPYLVISWYAMTVPTLQKARFNLISLYILTILVIIIKNSTDSQEKRIHSYTELPIPPWKIGFTRLLFIVTFWMGLLILFWISKWLIIPKDSTVDPIILWGMLYATGAVIIINGIYLIMGDLKYCFKLIPIPLYNKKPPIGIPQLLVYGMTISIVIIFIFTLHPILLKASPHWLYSFTANQPGASIGFLFMVFALGVVTIFIYITLIPSYGYKLKNVFITSLIVCIIGGIFIMAGTLPKYWIKTLVNLFIFLPQLFLSLLIGVNMFRKGHTGLIPRILFSIVLIIFFIFILGVLTEIGSEEANHYFSMSLFNPAVFINLTALGISFLGVLIYLNRRSYVK